MKKFSLRETNISKGVACILLLFHHLFYHSSRYDMYYHILGIDNPPLIAKIAIMSKVCVAIFVILSGYGLAKSFEKASCSSAYFTYKHIVKLLCQYWFVFIIFVPLGFFLGKNPVEIYGTGVKGITVFVIDFMGLANIFGTRTMNATWWYMGLIIILYMLFPIFHMTVKRYSYPALVGAFLICFFGTVTGRWYHSLFAWILPFVTGIYLAQKGCLTGFPASSAGKRFRLYHFCLS